MKTFGLIGFGKFGQAFCKSIIQGPVCVYDESTARMFEAEVEKQRLNSFGVFPGTFAEVSDRDVIFVAVPLQRLKETYICLEPLVKTKTLIVDCTSVQVRPRELAEQIFSKCLYINMHCLFGPESLAHGIKPLRAVLSAKQLGDAQDWLVDFLSSREIEVLVSSPNEHDKAMQSMVLCQVLAQVLVKTDVLRTEAVFHTGSFSLLYKMAGMLQGDVPEPYNTIVNGNPYAKQIIERLIQELSLLHKKIS